MYRATVKLADGLDPEFVKGWQRIYRSNPCRPLSDMSNEGSLFEGGGRIALDKDGILMTLGLGSSVRRKDNEDFDASIQAYTQRDTHDFGKILRIDRKSLAVSHIAKGFRNPQGLLVDDGGTIFMTEQGPQGGDELNIVVPGGQLRLAGCHLRHAVWRARVDL
jgi:glucose/arabinose dehydrogenase